MAPILSIFRAAFNSPFIQDMAALATVGLVLLAVLHGSVIVAAAIVAGRMGS